MYYSTYLTRTDDKTDRGERNPRNMCYHGVPLTLSGSWALYWLKICIKNNVLINLLNDNRPEKEGRLMGKERGTKNSGG